MVRALPPFQGYGVVYFTLNIDSLINVHSQTVTLPSAMEDRLPTAPAERFNRAAASVDFNLSQQRLIVRQFMLGGFHAVNCTFQPGRTCIPPPIKGSTTNNSFDYLPGTRHDQENSVEL